MKAKYLSKETASEVFDLLIEKLEAPISMKREFVFWFSTPVDGFTSAPTEWRFQGNLGFGGKLRWNDNGLYVDCYEEDLNPTKQTLIEEVNLALDELYKKELQEAETFSDREVIDAIKAFLLYGEETCNPNGLVKDFCHDGFASRALRYHLKQLNDKK